MENIEKIMDHERAGVSVVIPVRNRPAALMRALRSVQSQTLPVDEIIVVDDASTDDTVALAKAEALEDPRILVIEQQERQGAALARNLGVAEASYPWVAFLDSDDEWLPKKIEIQIEALKKDSSYIASFSGFVMISRSGNTNVVPKADLTLLDLQQSNVLGTTSTAMISKAAFDCVGGFDKLPSCQDWNLWLKLYVHGKFSLVEGPLVNFYQDGDDRISRNYTDVMNGHKIIFARILSRVETRPNRRIVRSAHLLRLSNIYLWDMGNAQRSILLAAASFVLNPSRNAVEALRNGLRSYRNSFSLRK